MYLVRSQQWTLTLPVEYGFCPTPANAFRALALDRRNDTLSVIADSLVLAPEPGEGKKNATLALVCRVPRLDGR